MKTRKNQWLLIFIFPLLLFVSFTLSGCEKKNQEKILTLRICNWEEYIDEGGWDKEETIDLENKDIIGKNSMLDDFVAWYEKTAHKKIKIEYSSLGTNEDLYNQLTLGDKFDLVCPSEYMIMKLMAEEKLEPLSDDFLDESQEKNSYIRGVSPYIKEFTHNISINNESIDRYAAGYMWGNTGIVYNPKEITAEEASSWKLLTDTKYKCRITMKDNVRDAYFAAMGIYKSDELLELAMRPYLESNSERAEQLFKEYPEKLRQEMNDTSKETMAAIEQLLQSSRNNFYSFETDNGKSDMVTGKVLANLQWSGDAVYSLDQAEEVGTILEYSVPYECSNLWFDGWVMLKDGIEGNKEKKDACEAFLNFMAQPDNVVRNMQYVGYTSVIAGDNDSTIFDYANWCYGAEEDEEETVEYDVSSFFGREDAIITTTPDQQLPKPSSSILATIARTRRSFSTSPCGSRASWLIFALTKSIAEPFLQAATQAPQPMQLAESIASSAFTFEIGRLLAS